MKIIESVYSGKIWRLGTIKIESGMSKTTHTFVEGARSAEKLHS